MASVLTKPHIRIKLKSYFPNNKLLRKKTVTLSYSRLSLSLCLPPGPCSPPVWAVIQHQWLCQWSREQTACVSCSWRVWVSGLSGHCYGDAICLNLSLSQSQHHARLHHNSPVPLSCLSVSPPQPPPVAVGVFESDHELPQSWLNVEQGWNG